MGYASVRPRVRELFEKNPGKDIWLNDFKEHVEMELDREVTVEGIRGAIRFLAAEGMEIEVLEQGHKWVYRPSGSAIAKSGGKIFELIKETKSGTMILEDTDGEVIIVRRVDL